MHLETWLRYLLHLVVSTSDSSNIHMLGCQSTAVLGHLQEVVHGD
jgi:hypothetical protein